MVSQEPEGTYDILPAEGGPVPADGDPCGHDGAPSTLDAALEQPPPERVAVPGPRPVERVPAAEDAAAAAALKAWAQLTALLGSTLAMPRQAAVLASYNALQWGQEPLIDFMVQVTGCVVAHRSILWTPQMDCCWNHWRSYTCS